MTGKDIVKELDIAKLTENTKITPQSFGKFKGIQEFKPLSVPTMFKSPKIKMPKMLRMPTITKVSSDILSDSLVQARKQTNTNPTPKQIKAENYKKGVFKWNGLTIAIENPKGSTRSGIGPDGKPWSIKMKNDYGYIKRTKSMADNDAIDVFIGDNLKSNVVYVIDQVNKDGSFDEHKCILGAVTIEDAKKTYLSNYEKGWTCGKITAMTLSHFKAWVKNGDTGKPVSEMNLFRIKGSK